MNTEMMKPSPRSVMRGFLRAFRERLEALPGVNRLAVWLDVADKAQAGQEVVASECLRENREVQTLIANALADDGVISGDELPPIIRRIEEQEKELRDCRIYNEF